MTFFMYSDLVKFKLCTQKECVLVCCLLNFDHAVEVKELAKEIGSTPAAAKKTLSRLYYLQWVHQDSEGRWSANAELINAVLKSLPAGEQIVQPKSAKKPELEAPQTLPAVTEQKPEPEAKPKKKQFVPPTQDEVEALMADYIDKLVREGDAKAATIDPHYAAQSFYEFYESNGWKVGRNSMKSWEMSAQRAIREWKNLQGSKYRSEYTQRELRNMTPTQRKEYEANKSDVPDEPFFKPEDLVYKADGTLDFSASHQRKIIREVDEEEAEKRRRGAIEGTAEEVQDPFLISQR